MVLQFNLSIYLVLITVYGIIRSLLFFKKSGNSIYIVLMTLLFVIMTDSWSKLYGGRVADIYATFSGIATILPLIVFVGYLYLETQRKKEEKEKIKVTGVFGKYVSKNVIGQLLKEKQVGIGGQRKIVTVLFTDIRGFTSLSESLPAEEVVGLLNRHFNVLTRIAFKYGGTVDKFIGDAVMVVFGAPLKQKDHALRAVKCGAEMQKKMAELNKELIKEGRELRIGVSINSGEAVVGNIGSDQFLDYTVVGDTVNIASRLQGFASAGDVVISENTYKEVKKYVTVLKKEKHMVKGKKKPLTIYKVKLK